MFKKYLGIAVLAAKNIFAKSPPTYRLIATLSILGLPLIIGYFVIDDLWTLEGFKNNWIAVIGPMLGIFFLFWIPEFLACIDYKMVPVVESTSNERIYLRASVLLFVGFLFFRNYVPARHSPDPFPALFGLVCLCFFAAGMILAFKAGRERKVMMGILWVVAIIAGSYLEIL